MYDTDLLFIVNVSSHLKYTAHIYGHFGSFMWTHLYSDLTMTLVCLCVEQIRQIHWPFTLYIVIRKLTLINE